MTIDDAIRSQRPFLAFTEASVHYDGRASSRLARGRYLILYKNDGSFLVTGGLGIPAKNYQGSKTALTIERLDKYILLTAIRKNEKILVKIYYVEFCQPLNNWSEYNTELFKTERDLVNKLVANHKEYYGFTADEVYVEYSTEHGPVDIMMVAGGIRHFTEVKRGTVNLSACSQLGRYLDGIEASARGYVAGPDISASAKRWCDRVGYRYIHIEHDEGRP